MILLRILLGAALLLVGGEALVRGSVGVAKRLGLSPLLIGLTLVGFGTSTPELMASIEAAFQGSPAIAIGNVVGSNIANILLILGTAAVIAPLTLPRHAFRRDLTVLAVVTLLMAGFTLAAVVSRAAGVALVVALAGYTAFSFLSERRSGRAEAEAHVLSAEQATPAHPRLSLGLATATGGILAVVAGADLFVAGAIALSRQAHVSEAVIGVTLVALGTSLPELVTSVVAALRGHSEVAYGNVVGSNIFNVLGIVGVTATLRPVPVPAELAAFDTWVMLGAVAVLAGTGFAFKRLGRIAGSVFLACYGLYILAVLLRGRAAVL